MEKVCPIHGTNLTLRPAGTSKAGKWYPAFWGCPTKNADGSFCKTTEKADNGESFIADLDKDTKKDFEDTKTDNIRKLNAINNACLLATHYAPEGKIREFIKSYADYIYGLEVGNEEQTGF